MSKKDDQIFVVKATAYGNKDQIISRPFTKREAEVFVNRLKKSMDDLEDEFKAFKNIEMVPYVEEPQYLNKGGKNPYTILDELENEVKKI